MSDLPQDQRWRDAIRAMREADERPTGDCNCDLCNDARERLLLAARRPLLEWVADKIELEANESNAQGLRQQTWNEWMTAAAYVRALAKREAQ